jgi:serine/threonine-protein kinase
MSAYAEAVSDEHDAREAIEVLPQYVPIVDPLTRNADDDDALGNTYLLAGKAEDAKRFLERATRSCRALDLPLSHTHAHLHLGETLERLGDAKGACEAYAVVLARWGAEPRSVSASLARDRSAKLGCAP